MGPARPRPDAGASEAVAPAERRRAGRHRGRPPGPRRRPAREALRAIARDLGLVVTGSSDYHGNGKVDHELGCNTTDPDDYARLLELADAAARLGPAHPEVVVVNSVLDAALLTEVFVTLFVIMDPPGTIPVFLSLTAGRSAATIRRAAWQAVAVSFFVIVGLRVLRPGGSCATCTSRSRPSRAPAGCCCSWSRWSC